MKSHTIRLKQNNMLCHKCVLNVVKTLSQLPDIEELDVNLDTKIIEIRFSNKKVSKETIENIVDQSIISGKIKKIPILH